MPYDLWDYSIVKLSSANVNVPRWTISARICKTGTKETIIDLTGANAVSFPAILKTLTAEQQEELIRMIAEYLIRLRYG